MPGILHERAIQEILETVPNAQKYGFGVAIRKAVIEPYQIEHQEDGRWRCHIVPDAYVIDHENRGVVAYEIEDAHRLTADKLRRYMDLAWEINEPHWSLLLVVVDRWGNMNGIDPLLLNIEQVVAAAEKKMREATPTEPELIIPQGERHELYKEFPTPPIADTGREG